MSLSRLVITLSFLLPGIMMPSLAEVIVTGISTERTRDVTGAVEVIGAEDLQLAGAASIADILRGTAPGIGTAPGDGSGNLATPALRGVGRYSPLVLIDGRRQPSPGEYDGVGVLQTIPPEAVERIETIRPGTAGALYGSAGQVGVINIITRRSAGPLRLGSDFAATSQGVDQGGAIDLYGTGLAADSGFGNWSGAGTPPAELLPALGIYDSFVRGFNGSVDFNLNCDFGSAGVLPGAFLSPWRNGFEYERSGDSFFVPFEQPAAGSGDDASIAADNEDVPEAEGPAAGAPADTGSDADATGNADAGDDGQPANADGSGLNRPPDGEQRPAPPTALQQWDRGVPPWSLVQRSPEVAHLLPLLEPYYKLRMLKNGERLALNSFYLSEYERLQNRDQYLAAFDVWKGTRREIITLLSPFIDPAIVATLETGDPIWDGDAGPVLPADALSELYPQMGSVTHPSQQAAQRVGDTGSQGGAESLPSPGSERPGGDAGLDGFRIGIKGIYRDFGINSYLLEEPSESETDARTGRDLSVQPYLGQIQYEIDGSATIAPLEGALYAQNDPFENELGQPRPDSFGDWERNADQGSKRGVSGRGGAVEYGDTRYDADRYLAPWISASSGLGRSANSEWELRYYYDDYDSRMDARQAFGIEFYDYAQDRIDFENVRQWLARMSQGPITPAEAGGRDFDPSRYRLGFNLREGFGGITIPLNKFEGYTVRTNGGDWTEFVAPGNGDAAEEWRPFISSQWRLNDDTYTAFRWAEGAQPGTDFSQLFGSGVVIEPDYCATEAFPANASTSSIVAGQRIDDDWFMKRIGAGEPAAGVPVTVAVIDTGLDYHHFDIDWDSLWYNEGEIRDNGIDDDGNGFVDDIFGWDFTVNSNTPWDHDGHGSFVTGLIAGKRHNLSGIDGLNPNARIMVLKALNNFGHTRASWMAQAIVYAADNGARIINLSAAGPGLPEFVQDAIDYADSNGVLVFVAAGNTAENIDAIGPAGLDKVITVAATGLDDSRAPFSNWGKRVDIAAPGMHVKSIRSRQTDFRFTSLDGAYRRGSAILDADRRAYRADGTSFAAPLVAGVASLIWSQNPELTHIEVRRMLEQSARDIDTPGRDQYTGYGLLDAAAALAADPAYFALAAIDEVSVVVVDGRQVARVIGTTDADDFGRAWLEVGTGGNPTSWKRVGKPLKRAVIGDVLGEIPASELQGRQTVTIRIVTEHANGSRREGRFRLNIG